MTGPAPILPIALEYGVELGFPVGEATIGGIWFVVNQGVSALQTFGVDSLLGDNPTAAEGDLSFYIMIGFQIVMIIPMFFVKENLKRKKYEEECSLNQTEIEEPLQL